MVTNIYLMYYWANAILIVQGKLCYLLGPGGTELYKLLYALHSLYSRNNIAKVKINIYVY